MNGWTRTAATLIAAGAVAGSLALGGFATAVVAAVLVGIVAVAWHRVAGLTRRIVTGATVGVSGALAIGTTLVAPPEHMLGYLAVILAGATLVSFAWLVFLPDPARPAVDRTAGQLIGVGIAVAGAAWVTAVADAASAPLVLTAASALGVAAVLVRVVTHPGAAAALAVLAGAGIGAAFATAGFGGFASAMVTGALAALAVAVAERLHGIDEDRSALPTAATGIVPVLTAGPLPVLVAIVIGG